MLSQTVPQKIYQIWKNWQDHPVPQSVFPPAQAVAMKAAGLGGIHNSQYAWLTPDWLPTLLCFQNPGLTCRCPLAHGADRTCVCTARDSGRLQGAGESRRILTCLLSCWFDSCNVLIGWVRTINHDIILFSTPLLSNRKYCWCRQYCEYLCWIVYQGLARAVYIRCMYGIFGRDFIKYKVTYGVYIQF